jgi:hypothetical protein
MEVQLVGNVETRTFIFHSWRTQKSSLLEGRREPEVPSGCLGNYSFIELTPSSKSSTTIAEESVLYHVKHALPQRYLLHNHPRSVKTLKHLVITA